MTIDNCKRLIEHYRKIGNDRKVEIYTRRLEEKMAKAGVKEEPKSKGKK